jgi:hypothetical protein
MLSLVGIRSENLRQFRPGWYSLDQVRLCCQVRTG